MTPEQAIARLSRMTASTRPPVLSADDLADLLAQYSLADAAGNAPGSTGWVPTYALNKAAAQGWLDKAAAMADRFTIIDNGQTLNREQVIAHCMSMHEQYRKKSGFVTLIMGGGTAASADVSNT